MKTSPEKTSGGFTSADTWVVVGSSVGDVHHSTPRLVAEEGSVGFEGPAGWEVVPHRPPKMRPGDKRVADTDLSPVIERLGGRTTNGGGGTNSVRELARLRESYCWPIRLCYIDTATPWPELAKELSSLQIEHRPLGLTPAAKNLVLTNGGGECDRRILKASVPPPAPLNGEWIVAVAGMRRNLKAVLINSVKSKAVAQAAVNTARQLGAALYSVATPSIPIDARIELLLPDCQLSQFNLAEFRELTEAIGIACPVEEEDRAVAGVARAIGKVSEILPCHDLAVKGFLRRSRFRSTQPDPVFDR